MINKSKNNYLRNYFQENIKSSKESWTKINKSSNRMISFQSQDCPGFNLTGCHS